MLESNVISQSAKYFLPLLLVWKRRRNIIRGFVLLLASFFALSACQDVGKAPVVTTIYIEENNNIPVKTEIDQPSIELGIEEILEKKEISDSTDIYDRETSTVEEKIVETKNKTNLVEKNTDEVSNTQFEEESNFHVASSSEPIKIRNLQTLDDVQDNILQNEQTETKEKKQEKLEIAALESAFEMLAKRAEPMQISPKTPNYGSKDITKSKFRIGLMVPLSGPFSHLGDTISGGSELAFFKMKNPEVELFYFDTAGGEKVIEAANSAIDSDVDVIIGPLFSDSVAAIKPLLKSSEIPILSFSNNIDVAEPGVWVLGYLPEQQIAQLVDFAVARGKQNFGVLSSSSQLGKKITGATIKKLTEYGLSPRTVLTLNDIENMDQNELLNQIKIFAQYIDTDKDPLTLPPPAFDTVVIAGDTNFILQVAPLLSYYDLGPDRALFIGIDKWNRPKMLTEPSLQNALLTLPKRPADEKFDKVWKSEFTIDSNDLSKISFDATALVIATAAIQSEVSLSERLVNQPGFIGFSGQFKMSKSGLTERVFEIREISDNFLVKPSIQ